MSEMTQTPADVRERVDVPGLPDGITPLTGVFTTHHARRPHAIVLWQGAPWLVWQHPDGHWVTEAKVQVAALRSEAPGEDGRDSVWVASAGVVYESGDAVDAFATEDEAVAWLKAQIDEWLRERLQWVEDEEEIEEIRSNAPEIEFGDGAHVVKAISGEWWKVQRYDLRAARRSEGGGDG